MHSRAATISLSLAILWCSKTYATVETIALRAPARHHQRLRAQADTQELADCPPGMVEASPTMCCWPGQRFSNERQGCVGKPTCPKGMVASAASCLPAPAQPPSSVTPPPPPSIPSRGKHSREEMVCPTGMQLLAPERCCWPGQSFGVEDLMCRGTPTCPPGMLSTGASCVLAPAVGGCTKDSECKGTRICERGQCVGSKTSGGKEGAPRTSLQTVPIRIVSERGDLPLSVLGAAGLPKTCVTPCSAQVLPGKVTLSLASSATPAIVNIEKPSTITFTGSSSGRLIGGIALTAAGVACFGFVISGKVGLIPAIVLGGGGAAVMLEGGNLMSQSTGGVTVSRWE
jgi:hypothetical protein